MVNKNKIKGVRWERDAVDLLNKNHPGAWRRIPGSGAIGTVLNMPVLKGDLTGKYWFFPKGFLAEAKVGYGGTQMTVSKEWFDKIRFEAEQNYSLPIVMLKFEKARSGVKNIIAMDIDTWESILAYIEELKREVDDFYERV